MLIAQYFWQPEQVKEEQEQVAQDLGPKHG